MFQEQGEFKVQQVERKTRNSEYLLPCSVPYLLSHRNPTLTVSQQITLNCPEDRLMSYKVLSLHTRNKIAQFCHEAFQQRHCSLNINLCCYLAPTAWRPRHLHPSTSKLSQETTNPAELTSAFPQPEIWVQTTRPPSKVTQNGVSQNYEVSGRSANNLCKTFGS